jgi:putative two-component system response regulator
MQIEYNPTILIADDDHHAIDLLNKILSKQGYRVICTSDGTTAHNKIIEYKPDLIILDNYMPGLSGNEICREIKSDGRTRLIPVVMLTGFGDTIEKVESIEAGVDDFITKPFEAKELTTRIRSLLKVKFLNDQLDSAEGVIFALARAIEAKDTYTQGHTERVSQYELKLGDEEINALFKGGILHDIGKIAVPDAILNKPGKLTDEEFTTIRTHPDRGEKICIPLNSTRQALKVVRHHHERLDGSGYPDHLKGDDVPVIARIMGIVDVYDALTTNRSYRPSLSQERAFDILEEEAGRGWWDKDILKVFKNTVTLS